MQGGKKKGLNNFYFYFTAMSVKLCESFLNKTKQVMVSKRKQNSHALRMINFAVNTFVCYCS